MATAEVPPVSTWIQSRRFSSRDVWKVPSFFPVFGYFYDPLSEAVSCYLPHRPVGDGFIWKLALLYLPFPSDQPLVSRDLPGAAPPPPAPPPPPPPPPPTIMAALGWRMATGRHPLATVRP